MECRETNVKYAKNEAFLSFSIKKMKLRETQKMNHCIAKRVTVENTKLRTWEEREREVPWEKECSAKERVSNRSWKQRHGEAHRRCISVGASHFSSPYARREMTRASPARPVGGENLKWWSGFHVSGRIVKGQCGRIQRQCAYEALCFLRVG